ncbi:Predicted kinase, aminoglycoside phosphotransferase (APT) family [Haladaptatus litoreus]|uniref:Predicted kinase, aminoglycoside phosphotransferase (APT) family n=1 Tax=Haladaptatus litoreus TaxID=553468 RepID=A0A1N7B519_9EURY|nr:phosphotransferase family protein [Haladaptatus litoreus]SIR46415.1 Predicted kinase, aminoglycoside phosphotransferase (APT) family [Haladaptatus litoreus]
MTTCGANIDFATLESYLSAELVEVVTGSEVLRDGLNLSLAISTERDTKAYVLRRPNMLRHTSYINELEQEYEVMQQLRETTMRTPAPVLFCDDESVLGDSFFVMTHLDGEAVPLGSDLPERFRNAKSRERLANNLIDTLAELHSLAVEPFEGVCERKTPRELVARVTKQFDEATSVTGHEPPELQFVAKWLRRNAPSKAETTLVHGDFRPGNVLFAETDHPEIVGVLDWETATLGEPRTDLGYLLLRWRDRDDPTPSLDELEARYSNEDAIEQLRERNENGISPFTAKSGSPSRRELVARYEDETGIQFENERFYRAHAAFSLAVVWEDFHREQIEAGEESDWEPHIDYMLMIAESIARGEFPL